ncbi:hypothetical protein FB45DRAFT_1060845 [Roridomyces roridus]|uniref:DUF6533 domain-containing protein n=1 Tax=Roridomyces roridus TaxID=1738132 RepID=A0AAD7FHM3_9AGAR|nr:hypothetical protein FB45DRAFT_1060845 [Roridomyces roridus]
MSDEQRPGEASIIADQFLVHDLFLVGLVVIVYDYLVTLPVEIHYIWLRRKRGSSYWFLLNRYLGLSIMFIIGGLKFSVIPPTVCETIPKLAKGFLISQEVVVFGILVLRVYAMFNLDRRILALLLVTGAAAFSMSAWLVSTQATVPPPADANLNNSDLPNHLNGFPQPSPGSTLCPDLIFHPTAIRVAGAWEGQFALDTLIFLLTVYRAFLHRRREEWQSSLLRCLFRDGAIYFFVLSIANLANILMYYYGDALLSGSLTWFASALSTVVLARLMLNLHAAASAGILMPGAGGQWFGDEHLYSDETGTASEDTGTVVFVGSAGARRSGEGRGRRGRDPWPARVRDSWG